MQGVPPRLNHPVLTMEKFMDLKTEVLIVGAGPTGLMMGCQLARFNIPFRIIDKNQDRSKESRAFGVQAKTMEIFQNLGIISEFLKKGVIGKEIDFYSNGKQRFKFNLNNIKVEDTPFPFLLYLPQSETEQILINYLEANHITIERQVELTSFNQTNDMIEVNVKNIGNNQNEKIQCRYIIGCDGAHSRVRQILEIPFVGAMYTQEFVLADVSLKWPFSKNKFTIFTDKAGIFIYIPIDAEKNMNRLMMAAMDPSLLKSTEETPSIEEIEKFAKQVTHSDVEIKNSNWISRFKLHHRAVKQYQKGSAFLAGDAAHIHSPVGGQGMNTGIQDVTNLAWKIASVLKYNSPKELLDTYQIERQRIGEVLVNTTDRIFGMLIKSGFFIRLIRLYVFPIIMNILTKCVKFNRRVFLFASESNIHYHENLFISELQDGGDHKFFAGPKAGFRAPDASIFNSTLFELIRIKPNNILIFQNQNSAELEKKLQTLEQIHPDLIAVHKFIYSSELKTFFDRYGLSPGSSATYFIRPDGYIGFRSFGKELDGIRAYLNKLYST